MPDDLEIENMDPVVRAWMFYNWSEDFVDNLELIKNHGYLIGSFTNPEAVQKLMGKDGTTYSTSDKEYEESIKLVVEDTKKDEEKNKQKKKRKRKKIIEK